MYHHSFLNIIGYINTLTGYGNITINLIRQLYKHCKIKVHPLSFIELGNQFPEFINLIGKPMDTNDPVLCIWHAHKLAKYCTPFKTKIGMSYFEIDNFDLEWTNSVNSVDHFIVASQWAKNIAIQNGVTSQIHVISPGIDPNIYFPGVNTQNGSYKFFHIGKFEERKCTKLIAKIFNEAFEKNDDVELHFMIESIFSTENGKKFHKDCEKSKLGNKIHFHKSIPDEKQYSEFIRAMDCGIFLSRAEGFQMPVIQSIASGKPVISTAITGNSEFLNDLNCFIVPVNNFIDAIDGINFYGGGAKWGDIDHTVQEAAISYMKYCYNNKMRYNPGHLEIVKKFNWQNCSEKILKLL